MGKCIYCGKGAGLFRKKHKECEDEHNAGLIEYSTEVFSALKNDQDYSNLPSKLDQIKAASFLTDDEAMDQIANGFDSAVLLFLDDGVLSKDEEEKIGNFKEQIGVSQEVLDKNGSFLKVALSAVLREIVEGNIPEQRIALDGSLPFVFQKSEKLIWVFPMVDFFEQRTKTEYVGGSQGASIRIAKGLYYRTSSFRGKPVRTQEMKFIDTGILALTTKHVYFNSSTKTFKVPFTKLVSLEPYEDGIGLQKDGVTAKPQVFRNLDGWFLYNAISNLINMS